MESETGICKETFSTFFLLNLPKELTLIGFIRIGFVKNRPF